MRDNFKIGIDESTGAFKITQNGGLLNTQFINCKVCDPYNLAPEVLLIDCPTEKGPCLPVEGDQFCRQWVAYKTCAWRYITGCCVDSEYVPDSPCGNYNVSTSNCIPFILSLDNIP